MAGAGYGTVDVDGSWGFKATADGKVILGNTSDDVLQITGSVEQEGSSYQISGDDARIKINGDTDSHPGLEFSENGTRKWIIFNNYLDDSLDFKSGPAPSSTTRMVIDADGKVGVGTDSPSTTLDVDGTIKGDYYITTPSTQDLGSGTSSTLSIGSSLMFLDADSITGAFHAQMGMDVHTLNLPNGTTSGQRLTLVIEGTMGSADNMPIMLAGNLMGAIDMFVPTAKTSLNFVYYSSASISAWYQV
jgi:hypothetical protein